MSYEGEEYKVDFGTIKINGTGDYSVTGLGFKPSKVKFEGAVPIDSTDSESAGGSGSTESNYMGTMVGYAKDDGSEQVMCSGGSGNSINNIRYYSSSSHCVGVSYGGQNGGELAQITATMSSWDSDGFTINCDTYSSVADVTGLLVMYTVWY